MAYLWIALGCLGLLALMAAVRFLAHKAAGKHVTSAEGLPAWMEGSDE